MPKFTFLSLREDCEYSDPTCKDIFFVFWCAQDTSFGTLQSYARKGACVGNFESLHPFFVLCCHLIINSVSSVYEHGEMATGVLGNAPKRRGHYNPSLLSSEAMG